MTNDDRKRDSLNIFKLEVLFKKNRNGEYLLKKYIKYGYYQGKSSYHFF